MPPLGRGKFLADPFGAIRNAKLYVVCEEFDYRRGRGVLVSIEFSRNDVYLNREPLIAASTHMSYPCLVEDDGRVYCVPESHRESEISLYEAEAFPREWRKVAILVRGVHACDPTVFQHKGRWWLAYTDYDRGANDALFIWHSKSLLGPWEPHTRNPVKIDARSARGAGTPFRRGGDFFRPAQDCTRLYGERVVLNRIQRLTPTEFEEETVAVVPPFEESPYPDGIHTLSAVGDATLVDSFRFTFIEREFRQALSEERNQMRRRVSGLLHGGPHAHGTSSI